MKKSFAMGSVFFLLLQLGCGVYHFDRPYHPYVPPKLGNTGSVYVSVCEDGRSDSAVYRGSGRAAAQFIRDEFSYYYDKVALGTTTEPFEQALKSALHGGYRYLVFASIEDWKDHVRHDKTGIPDQIKIKIILAETLSEELIDSVTIRGRSPLFTLGGHPQDLLPVPIRIYVASLFE